MTYSKNLRLDVKEVYPSFDFENVTHKLIKDIEVKIYFGQYKIDDKNVFYIKSADSILSSVKIKKILSDHMVITNIHTFKEFEGSLLRDYNSGYFNIKRPMIDIDEVVDADINATLTDLSDVKAMANNLTVFSDKDYDRKNPYTPELRKLIRSVKPKERVPYNIIIIDCIDQEPYSINHEEVEDMIVELYTIAMMRQIPVLDEIEKLKRYEPWMETADNLGIIVNVFNGRLLKEKYRGDGFKNIREALGLTAAIQVGIRKEMRNRSS